MASQGIKSRGRKVAKNRCLKSGFFAPQNGQLNNKKELDIGFQEGGLFGMGGKGLEGKSIWEVDRETTDSRVTSFGRLQSIPSAKWRHKI